MPRREQTIEEYFEAAPSDDGWALRALCSLCFGFPWPRDVTLDMTDAGDMAPSFACTANTVALQLVIAEPTSTRIDHPLRVAGVSNGNVGT